MATTARLDLAAWRNDDVSEVQIRVRGVDLSAVALRMQIRLGPDTPGAALVDLAKVTNGNAQGLRVADVTFEAGAPVSDLRVRINKLTLQALPYAGAIGDDAGLTYALQIGGRTRLRGSFTVLAHEIDSDAAPLNRPAGGGTRGGRAPIGGATLTIAGTDVTEVVLDGADLIGRIADSVEAARLSADASAARAAAAAAVISGGRGYAVDGYGPAIDGGYLSGSTLAAMQRVAVANIAANRSKWQGSTDDYFRAAPGYPGCYMSDFGLTVTAFPQGFTAEQLVGVLDRFYARISNGSGASGHTAVAGEMPMVLNPDGTVLSFYSGWDKAHRHATGDGAFLAPLVEEQVYLKTGSVARIAAGAGATLLAALDAIPRNPATGMVRVVAGDEWVPWAFQEMAKFTGDVLLGSVFYWRACAALANLFLQAGDQATYDQLVARCHRIEDYLRAPGCPLWNAASGMFFSATGQSKAICVLGSSFASRWNIISPAQQVAVSDYLAANYDALTHYGFWKQTPGNWPVTGVTPPSGGAPYRTWMQTYPESTFPYANGSYQHAFWSVGNEWVLSALAVKHPWQAAIGIADFARGSDMTMEYWAPDHGAGDPIAGFNLNLCSPVGTIAFALVRPDLVQIRLRSQGVLGGVARDNVLDQLGGFVMSMVAPSGGDAVSYVSRGGIARAAGFHAITDDDFGGGFSLRLKEGTDTGELVDRTQQNVPILAWEQSGSHARMDRAALEIGGAVGLYVIPDVGVFFAANATWRNGAERPINPAAASSRYNVVTGVRQIAPATGNADASPVWVAA